MSAHAEEVEEGEEEGNDDPERCDEEVQGKEMS